jgi:hypothetical protein
LALSNERMTNGLPFEPITAVFGFSSARIFQGVVKFVF